MFCSDKISNWIVFNREMNTQPKVTNTIDFSPLCDADMRYGNTNAAHISPAKSNFRNDIYEFLLFLPYKWFRYLISSASTLQHPQSLGRNEQISLFWSRTNTISAYSINIDGFYHCFVGSFARMFISNTKNTTEINHHQGCLVRWLSLPRRQTAHLQ